jgi:dethiobiotin synthetase
MQSLFVTGTDTGVGKTVVCGLLAGYLRGRGLSVITQKWIQTGTQAGDRDIDAHDRWAGGADPAWAGYADLRMPCAYALPASPHLAAAQAQQPVDCARIRHAFQGLTDHFDCVVVEGIGGVLVPIDDRTLAVDLVRDLSLPVLVVTANRLGTINHTLLTVEALRTRGLVVLGLVFHAVPNEDPIIAADNPRIVAAHTGVPVLGQLPWSEDVTEQQRAFTSIGAAILERLEKGKQ